MLSFLNNHTSQYVEPSELEQDRALYAAIRAANTPAAFEHASALARQRIAARASYAQRVRTHTDTQARTGTQARTSTLVHTYRHAQARSRRATRKA